MNTDGWKKFDRLFHIIKLFQQQQTRGWRAKEIADLLGVNEDTANDYLKDLGYSGILPITREKGLWRLPEGAMVPSLELSLSYPEAVSLYLAGRLLAQTQDEQNWHMTMALQKLVEALPPSLLEQQKTLLELLVFEDEQNERPNLSNIFQALATGWVKRQSVRLVYAPAKGREFECVFDPYLMEPSAIGRTIYVLGYSSASKALRTYKLERMQRAELTGKTFELSPDFKGAEYLQQAWIVMYSDETPVRVRLRFSATVTPRVRETRWHPNQNIIPTRDGCEWSALIGDTLEIEPWIRGWGSECEVLEPLELRETMLNHVRRAMQVYGLHAPTTEPRDPGVFNRSLFRKEEE